MYNFNFNIFFFYKLYVYFKKSNSVFKKLNKFFTFSNFNNFSDSSTILFKNTFALNKYFVFYQHYNVNSNNSNNSLKLTDLKKKFTNNLYNFKNEFNLILNIKKTIKTKTLFKNYKIFFMYFLKYNSFFFEYNLIKILMKLKFIYNYSDFFFFSKKQFIYINRTNYNPGIMSILKKNDVIELIFNKLYIKYLEKILKISSLNKIKKKYKLKSKLTPCYYFFDFFNKTINYESSFKSNTIILFYNNFNLFNLANYYSFFFNYYLLKLYRWRY